MRNAQTLKAPPEYPESARPAHVQKLHRPPAMLQASQLAFLMFEKTDLGQAERFWNDFGLVTVTRTADELVMRGAGTAPALLIARRANQSRYTGAAFVVPAGTDFEPIQKESGAQPLPDGAIPGGGRGVRLSDPDGHDIWLITDWGKVDPLPMRAPLTGQMNNLASTPRVNQTVRADISPASVGRLGHVVMQTTDFPTMANWYMRHLGLVPTDVQYLADGSTFLTFFRLNLGDTPTDHHTVVISAGVQAQYEHSAWEVLDLDALGQGQQVLKANGHRHLWGIGRHVLGSQLFDYWKDADGFKFEHYTDSDVFTSAHETRYVPFLAGSIWAWGHDVPADMFPPKTPALLWRVIKLLWSGRISIQRLRLMAQAVDTPARPWL